MTLDSGNVSGCYPKEKVVYGFICHYHTYQTKIGYIILASKTLSKTEIFETYYNNSSNKQNHLPRSNLLHII